MKYYFAPMEGITGYIHRNAYQMYFPYIDKYFTAFIAPNQKGKLSSKEKNDILPEHNRGMNVVPQLLTNNGDDFLRTCEKLMDYGYGEVNLNLGCPSKTVVSKYRGSGFLIKTKELNQFLNDVFGHIDMKISIKTRIGRDDPEEFRELMDIYNQYPLEELIIHPRTQKDYYKNKPNLEVFREALGKSRCPVCYNGDLFTVEDYKRFRTNFPEVDRVMLGRGLLMNPMLIEMIEEGAVLDKAKLKMFHDKVYEDYKEVLFGDRAILFKMKELWAYMANLFQDNKKHVKKIRKAEKGETYEDAVEKIFRELDVVEEYSGIEKEAVSKGLE